MAFKRGFLKKGLQLDDPQDTPSQTTASTASEASTTESGSLPPRKPDRYRKPQKVFFATNSSPKYINLPIPKQSVTKWIRSGGTQGMPSTIDHSTDPASDSESEKSNSEISESDSETEPEAKDCFLACVRFGGVDKHFCFMTFPDPNLRVRVGESRVSGKSLYSKLNVPRSEVIIFEYPILIQLAYLPSLVVYHFELLVREMEPETRARLEALYNCKPTGPKMNDSLSKCRTNACGSGLLFEGQQDDLHMVVHDLMSRVNHSCDPNARKEFIDDDFYGILRARRPIAAGEEITVNYCELDLSREERQAELRRNYRFECQCEKCLRESLD